jgi:glycosyltransferase involved in cell wall biosynthesis
VTRQPTVSVAICLLNSSRFIDETLGTVFAQTFDDYEVILVDDGSTDGCADAIERRYGDRVRVIRQTHQGLSIARRLTIAAASGEYVAFLDHDDLWAPDKLERQVAAARADPSIALLFSDCEYIDEQGAPIGLLSEQYRLDSLDIRRGYEELLRRGCFVWQSSVLARTDVLRAVDAFNPAYPYIADYDTWVRIARRHRLHYSREVLAKWRVHRTQFTTRCPEVTLADHRALLGSLYRTASIPEPTRILMGDRLLGQHRVSCRLLLRQKRVRLAARAAVGMLSYPDRLLAFVLGTIAELPIVGRRVAGVYRAIRRLLRTPKYVRRAVTPTPSATTTPVWIDGSALGVSQTGYFNLVSELIRTLVHRACIVHVTATAAGRQALEDRLGADASRLRFHPAGWRALRGTSRLTRLLNRPLGSPPHPATIEVVVWRGRFRWTESRRVAIVQDLTTRIHPELHTPGNVADFEEFLGYVQRHATKIATISDHTRNDLIDRLRVFPDSVSVIPMPLHPCYVQPRFDRAFVAAHGIRQPYVLCVGCIEPRKNLRRLVRAFEMLKEEPSAGQHLLVFAGPKGWDEAFPRDLIQSDIYRRIRMLGFVPTEHLPSLYHFATAVAYPSLYEGFGLPVFEAMSSSSVVVASRTSSIPEVLGDAGVLFDPLSTDAIAGALLQALTLTPADAADFRRRARRRAELLIERSEQLPLLPGLPAGVGVAAT